MDGRRFMLRIADGDGGIGDPSGPKGGGDMPVAGEKHSLRVTVSCASISVWSALVRRSTLHVSFRMDSRSRLSAADLGF